MMWKIALTHRRIAYRALYDTGAGRYEEAPLTRKTLTRDTIWLEACAGVRGAITLP